MLVELTAFVFFCFSLATRSSLPQLYTSLINNDASNAPLVELFKLRFTSNIFLWFSLFGTLQCILYLKRYPRYKLNKKYPTNKLILMEFARSVLGVSIGTMIEVAVERLYASRHYPLLPSKTSMYLETSMKLESQWMTIALAMVMASLLLMVIGETHFYFSHRLLHTKWLYKNVHKVHHESINPDPCSGLSMHWIESTLYFSVPLFIGVGLPFWMARMMTKLLLITPIQGHSGHSNPVDGNAMNDLVMNAGIDHFIHHAFFNYNFGANPFWDIVCKTNYPEERKRTLLMEFREAACSKMD